ncbi:apolipoprotein N-acyltransferase [Solemya pervernicosa gill symbiont]|uniref:Apolipoprotein N-acyltransferase n=2 Tax=Gammaproteobacteria incertae sedis TaxID=118884 RepID=A0A1T2L787_9GAMM|nr:apolipoprotein N-acyltransferase [Candidatus Reidiella endopervernicosa]OOZ40904.1 apolipoprotein N-acyltransferase [Solemya pervernicosa gill symbiont]
MWIDRWPGWRGYWRELLALIVGALLPLAFAPFGFVVFAFASPATLFLLWNGVDARRSFRIGYLFGIGMFAFGASWVYVSIHDFGNAPLPLALLVTLLFIAVLAFFPALLGYFGARISLAARGRYLLLLPAGWVALEWVRGSILGGFPWLLLGQGQIDTPLSGYAPWLGVYGVSWVVALTAGAVALLIRTRSLRLPTVVIAVLWLVPLLLNQFSWTEPLGKVRVALLQGNIEQDQKWLPEVREMTLRRYAEMTMANPDSDLIVWPETAIPAFLHWVEGSYTESLQQFARQSKTDLLIGVPYQEQESYDYYNSVVSFGAEQRLYHKRHLVPFGEFLPFKPVLSLLGNFLAVPMTDFARGGEEQPLLSAAGYPVGTSICYEAAFGEEIAATLPEAALLVNVTNDAWFGHSLAPAQHLQISRMRALETGRYMLRVANTGITAIIGPDGKVEAHTEQFETTVLKGEVEAREGITPYVRWGNWPVLILLFSMLATIYLTRGRADA